MTDQTPVSPFDPRIGRALEDLDTPTLLLDRAASDRNLARMAAFFETARRSCDLILRTTSA